MCGKQVKPYSKRCVPSGSSTSSPYLSSSPSPQPSEDGDTQQQHRVLPPLAGHLVREVEIRRKGHRIRLKPMLHVPLSSSMAEEGGRDGGGWRAAATTPMPPAMVSHQLALPSQITPLPAVLSSTFLAPSDGGLTPQPASQHLLVMRRRLGNSSSCANTPLPPIAAAAIMTGSQQYQRHEQDGDNMTREWQQWQRINQRLDGQTTPMPTLRPAPRVPYLTRNQSRSMHLGHAPSVMRHSKYGNSKQ
jgi:hypothetical protein